MRSLYFVFAVKKQGKLIWEVRTRLSLISQSKLESKWLWILPFLNFRVVYRSWTFGFDSGIPRVTTSGRFYDSIGLRGMTSRYQANPGEGYWTSVKNILKYLRRTNDVFLVYGGEEELGIKGYIDASFQTDKDDSRSQSGFVFCLNGGAVSWKSSKQDTIADSTTEAEYIAASKAAKEAVWIKKFKSELGVIPGISDAVELYCDNNGAIAQAKEPRSHQRSKHILRRFHLIREIIDQRDVEICKVHTDDNITDPLTKPLAQQKHDRHTESLDIRYVSDWS
ncbi:hypothetical protein GQ457_13G016940 [Hibiscus cannabinus]